MISKKHGAHPRTGMRTHTRARASTHARTHARTHTQSRAHIEGTTMTILALLTTRTQSLRRWQHSPALALALALALAHNT